MTHRCDVCGAESDGAVCARCGTILLVGQAICPKCGKLFPGRIAVCDSCGRSLEPTTGAPPVEEATRLLASFPGITEDRARELAARGFHDVSDIVRLALPEAAVERGLHHAIARRALLAELAPEEQRGARGERCPVCSSPWPLESDRCPTCGSSATDLPPTAVTERNLEEVAEEIVSLPGDQDSRSRLEDIRKKLFDTFQSIDPEDLVRREYRRQIDAWREKGFDVAPLEDLLLTDLDRFRKDAVRLIRAQIRAKAAERTFPCPLCNEALPAQAAECTNCGAKLA